MFSILNLQSTTELQKPWMNLGNFSYLYPVQFCLACQTLWENWLQPKAQAEMLQIKVEQWQKVDGEVQLLNEDNFNEFSYV